MKVQNEDKYWNYYQTDEVDDPNKLSRKVVEIFTEKFEPVELKLSDLLMLISSSDEDHYHQSCLLVTPQLLEYHTRTDRQLVGLREEMHEITMNL